jgi:hypothetical protein
LLIPKRVPSYLTVRTIHSPGGYFGFVIVGLVIVQILTISLGVMGVTSPQRTTPQSNETEPGLGGSTERFQYKLIPEELR